MFLVYGSTVKAFGTNEPFFKHCHNFISAATVSRKAQRQVTDSGAIRDITSYTIFWKNCFSVTLPHLSDDEIYGRHPKMFLGLIKKTNSTSPVKVTIKFAVKMRMDEQFSSSR